jgi:hypothetical protein
VSNLDEGIETLLDEEDRIRIIRIKLEPYMNITR